MSTPKISWWGSIDPEEERAHGPYESRQAAYDTLFVVACEWMEANLEPQERQVVSGKLYQGYARYECEGNCGVVEYACDTSRADLTEEEVASTIVRVGAAQPAVFKISKRRA